MKHLAAYMLCTIGGNAAPTDKDVKKVLAAAGIEADDERLSKLSNALSGKDIDQLTIQGLSKLASVPSGGAAPAAAAGASAPSAGAKAEEKKEVKKEESDEDMGFGLFD